MEFASSAFLTVAPPKHRLRIHRFASRGFFVSYVDGLCRSYARLFLASTHARFYEELDRETAILKKLLAIDCLGSQKYSCPVYFKQQLKLCFCSCCF